jgi:ketosteroid isomerase-like protein
MAARGGSEGGRRSDPGRGLMATVARWPLEVERDFDSAWNGDASIAVVRRTLADYRSGRADQASRVWQDDIVWTVRGVPPAGGRWTGAEGVFAYHRLLERLSGGTYRQHLLALEGSRGPIVNAYLRTTARRRDRQLSIPTLAVFELVGGRVSRVTELPGDLEAWQAFWAD